MTNLKKNDFVLFICYRKSSWSKHVISNFIRVSGSDLIINIYHFVLDYLLNFVLLNLTDSNIWSRDVYVPANQDVPYRYLICTVDPITENVHVRRWETHLNPRQISADHGEVTQIDSKSSPVAETAVSKPSSPSTLKNDAPEIDTFGDIKGLEKIDRGWLTTETMFQFKFIRNPFILKQKLKNRLLFVKVS